MSIHGRWPSDGVAEQLGLGMDLGEGREPRRGARVVGEARRQRASRRRIRSSSAARCGQPAAVTMTRDVVQLKPALLVSIVAMFSAW